MNLNDAWIFRTASLIGVRWIELKVSESGGFKSNDMVAVAITLRRVVDVH